MMPKSRRARVAAVCAGAVAAAALLAGQVWLFAALSWTHREPPADSHIGINFSCDQAEFLLLEQPGGPYVSDERPDRVRFCFETLDRLLAKTGAEYVRISVQWDEVEPAEGQFDFELLDALLVAADNHGAGVMLSIGMKAQRHPEYYIPEWALEGTSIEDGGVISDDPLLRKRALSMVAAVTRHFAANDVVDSWGAENEPYIRSHRSNQWRLSREYAAEVVRTIRQNDPSRRPVSINHAQHFVMDRRWQEALADSDVLSQSMYPRRNMDILGFDFVVNIMELGPLMPNYAHQAREARHDGKQFWVTELQGEPWTDGDSRLISPGEPSPNLSPDGLRSNVVYARKSGAERIYLWGSEWWLFQADRYGDHRWLEAARAAVAGE
jgi:hypothetical protein